MIQAKTELIPANWQITATTIYCNHVEDYVTVMVDKDWTTKCAWFKRYKQKALDDKKQKFGRSIKKKIEECIGPECPLAIEYRDKLIKEESETEDLSLKN